MAGAVARRVGLCASVFGLCLVTLLLGFGGAALAGPVLELPGSFGVSDAGQATYSVPIEVPPGTGGMAPSLSLSYSSGGGNGILGMGWSLMGLPSITRCAATIAQDGVTASNGVKYDATDDFCYRGQKLVAITGTYSAIGSGCTTTYRTEVESFTNIIATCGSAGPTSFKVQTKSGQTLYFGYTADSPTSQVLVPGSQTVASWLLSSVVDASDNKMEVTYNSPVTAGMVRPLKITYTFNAIAGQTTAYDEVFFCYAASSSIPCSGSDATRPDSFATWQTNVETSTTSLLQHIQTYTSTSPSSSTLVSDYQLTYAAGTTSNRSLLQSITRCGNDGTCLPATNFTYDQGTTITSSATPSFNGIVDNQYTMSWFTADFAGSGRESLIQLITSAGQNTNSYGIAIFINNGNNQYTETSLGTWTPSPKYNTKCTITPVVGDFNGDGKADIYWDCADGSGFLWLGNGDGTFQNVNFSNGQYGVQKASSLAHQMAVAATVYPAYQVTGLDIDGDGHTDLLFSAVDLQWSGVGTYETWMDLNSVGNFTISQPTWPTAVTTGIGVNVASILVGDFQAHGRSDLFVSKAGVAQDGNIFLLAGAGDGTFAVKMLAGTNSVTQSNGNYWAPSVGYFGRDGNAGLIWIQTGVTSGQATGTGKVWVGQGAGVFNSVTLPTVPVAKTLLLGDFNGTGRTDILWANYTGSTLWLSNGNGSFRTSGTGAGTINPSTPYYQSVPYVGDFSGDGKADVLWLGATNQAVLESTLWLSDPTPTDLLLSVTSGLAATTTVAYDVLTDSSVYTKGSDATYPRIDLQSPMRVVSSVAADTGLANGTTYTTNYAYGSAKLELDGRGFLGFQNRTISDMQGNVDTITYQTSWPYTGLVLGRTRVNGSVTLTSVMNTNGMVAPAQTGTVSSGSTAPDYDLVELQKVVETDIDLNGQPTGSTTTTYTYDSYANPTAIGVVTTDPNISGSTQLTGASKNGNVQNVYTNDATNWYIGRLVCTRPTDYAYSYPKNNASNARATGYQYDTLGRLVSTIIEPTSAQGTALANLANIDNTKNAAAICTGMGAPLNAVTTISYAESSKTFGNPTKIVSAPSDGTGSRETDLVYGDGEHRFATSKTLVNGGGTNLTYQYSYGTDFGEVLTQTDPSGLVATNTYDAFGRLATALGTDGNWTDWTYTYCTSSCTLDQVYLYTAYTASDHSTLRAPHHVDYYDPLGRVYATHDGGFAAGVNSLSYYDFDTNYNLYQKIGPELSSGQGSIPIPTTTYAYDAEDRLIKITLPDTSLETIARDGLETIVTKGNTTTTSYRHRSGVALETLDDYQNATTYVDATFGNIASVADPAGDTVSYGYDQRGHVLSATHPDSGTTAMTYTSFGQLATRRTAKSSSATTFQYDALGRLTGRVEPDLTSAWVWDAPVTSPQVSGTTCPGLLYQSSATGSGAAAVPGGGFYRQYAYTTRCRPLATSHQFGGGAWSSATSGYTNGFYTSTTYPDGFATQWDYSASGYANEVDANLPGTSSGLQTAWQLNSLDGFGRPLRMSVGGGIGTGVANGALVTTDTYDVGERLTAETIAVGSATPIVNTSYTWLNIALGDLQQRVETGSDLGAGITNVTDKYSYDGLHELTRDQVLQNGSQSYLESYGYVGGSTPDGTYRIATKGSMSYLYNSSATPNAPSGISSAPIAYDGDGNTTSYSGQVFTWSSFDMALTETVSGTTTQFYYDADHRRIRQVVTVSGTPTTTDYLWDAYASIERVTTGSTITWRDYFNSPYGLVGSAYGTPGATYNWLFPHGDHHDSVGTTTNASEASAQCVGYEAFGKRRFCSGAEDTNNTINSLAGSTRGMIGQEELDTTNLVDLNARLYNPQTGLFLSPDPSGLAGGPAPYAYAANNPTTNADPTGLDDYGHAPAYDPIDWTTLSSPADDLAELHASDSLNGSYTVIFNAATGAFSFTFDPNNPDMPSSAGVSGGQQTVQNIVNEAAMGGSSSSLTASGGSGQTKTLPSGLGVSMGDAGALIVIGDPPPGCPTCMQTSDDKGGLYWETPPSVVAPDEINVTASRASVSTIDNVMGHTLEFVYGANILAMQTMTGGEGEGLAIAERVAPYAVGTYDALRARSIVGDALDIHHVVQANPARQVIPGYLRSGAPSIALPEAEHALIPRLSGPYTGTARDLLARDIRNLRNFTNAPNSSLRDLIDLNKQMYPGAFAK